MCYNVKSPLVFGLSCLLSTYVHMTKHLIVHHALILPKQIAKTDKKIRDHLHGDDRKPGLFFPRVRSWIHKGVILKYAFVQIVYARQCVNLNMHALTGRNLRLLLLSSSTIFLVAIALYFSGTPKITLHIISMTPFPALRNTNRRPWLAMAKSGQAWRCGTWSGHLFELYFDYVPVLNSVSGYQFISLKNLTRTLIQTKRSLCHGISVLPHARKVSCNFSIMPPPIISFTFCSLPPPPGVLIYSTFISLFLYPFPPSFLPIPCVHPLCMSRKKISVKRAIGQSTTAHRRTARVKLGEISETSDSNSDLGDIFSE